MNARKFATRAAAVLGLTGLLGAAAFTPAHALEIKLPQESAQLKASTLAGHQAASAWCVMCHSIDYINSQPPMPASFWSAEVTKMVKVYGAPIPEDQVKLISEYLGKTYGNDAK
ncbi:MULTISPECIES: sulfite:cytochrome C oxidoreductase subunit B [Pandoraea]|uniref:Sulfite:cytochrome C oxidoreductase subunit B n=1 Tax=Pandoraea nosoerga TaxID=2508296 RepID=A0A5E4UKD0_9BURK|nr:MULTISPECIES: sulfite:cytochrome C oxidoreductase subunit B [Pandoraea]VVE00427.1 sulfite:cytochrome C oxidoreductase subunit B [Pandoraea nosoerga]